MNIHQRRYRNARPSSRAVGSLVQSVTNALQEWSSSARKIIASACGLSLLVTSGVAYAGLYAGGPAEAWTLAQISALTSAIYYEIMSFQNAYMYESNEYYEQLISAIAVATKQEAVSANQVGDAIRNSNEEIVNAVRAQRTNSNVINTYLNYSPATGQGYDACATLARNRSLDAAFDSIAGAARSTVSELDAAPGALVDSRSVSMSKRLQEHRSLFCTQSEADARLCTVSSTAPGGDSNAGLLFVGADSGSDQDLARKAFIRNVIGPPDQKMPAAAGKSPAGQAFLFEKNRMDSFMSIPAYSLASIAAANTRTNDQGGKSADEILQLRINQYFGGKEAQQWSASMATQTQRGLMVEANKMAGAEAWLYWLQYQQGQRLEANLAALVLASTEQQQKEVNALHQEAVMQTASKAIK